MLKHLMVNGKYIYYEDEGSGTPILFLHPPGVGRKIFRYQSAYLKHKYRVITIDLSGSGDSRSCSSSPTMTERAEEVSLFISGLGLESVHLAGYSGGCAIALTAAMRIPKQIRSLILIEGFARIDQRLHNFLYKAGIKMLEEKEEWAIRLISGYLTNDSQLNDILRNHMRKSNLAVWISDYKNLLQFNQSVHLSKILVPTLVIQKNPYKAGAEFNRIPGIQVVYVKERGSLLMKKWEKVNGEIDSFIRRMRFS
ncbi:alpha/beta fold hydrolase [Peribacillus deserti]|uniref:AB hydrolase-1 domain-containing protein n=1 Tax=Peribacillus deserti TaxID=673318 RepID=A0A2N5LZU2_9BACI|nr:alpha/beta hydrolase [Peribacillus deserti]PLT27639.1 hypothetical protein CUU66_22750 [Peribacillus deserti]